MPEQSQGQSWKPVVPASQADPENQVHIEQHSLDSAHFHTC